MKQLATFIILLFSASFASAQQAEKDSFYRLSIADNPPKIKLDHELMYAYFLNSISLDTSLAQLAMLEKKYKNDEYATGRILSDRSEVLSFKGEYKKALEEGHKALKIQRKLNDTSGLSHTANRLARSNMMTGRLDDAITYVKEYIVLSRQLGDSVSTSKGYENLGLIKEEQGKYQEAIDQIHRANAVVKDLKIYYLDANRYYNLAAIHNTMNQPDSFYKYISLCISTYRDKTRRGQVPVQAEVALAAYQIEHGSPKLAIPVIKKGIAQAERKNNLERQIYTKGLLSQAYYKDGQYKLACDVSDEHSELKDSMDAINNAKDIAEIEEKYKNAENQLEIINLKNDNLESENKAQRYMFLAALMAAICLLLGFLYYRKQQKRALHDSEIKARLEAVKLSALRSQMNPHFLFNCINTAQNFILDAKKKEAYMYLEKFAKLLRKVLNHSADLYISVDEEIEQLKLYLDLESIRSQGGVEYSVKVDDQLKNGIFEIPGMVIQPFVENALIHGLQNKSSSSGKVDITLSKKDNHLNVEITDNGVGREEAMRIKKKKETRYKSVAIPNIRERIKIMRENKLGQIKVDILDLFAGTQPTGTMVKLELPLN